MDDLKGVKTEIMEEDDDQDARIQLYSVMEVGMNEGPFNSAECKTGPTEKVEEVENFKRQSEVEPGINESLPTASSDSSRDELPDPIEMVCVKMEPLEEQECGDDPSTFPGACSPVEDCEQSEKVKGGKQTKHPPMDPSVFITKTVGGRKWHQCKTCQYSTVKLDNLRKHLVIHTRAKKFSCSLCSASFPRVGHLRRHLLSHADNTSAKPYQCKFCRFSANQAGNLQAHLRIHSGERPFSCGECDYTCRTSSGLTRHKMTHTGLKPYVCEICSLRFSHAFNLKTHIFRHTGDKPFKCDGCKYECVKKSDLTRHVKSQHSGKRGSFDCAHCKHRAATKRELIEHFAKQPCKV